MASQISISPVSPREGNPPFIPEAPDERPVIHPGWGNLGTAEEGPNGEHLVRVANGELVPQEEFTAHARALFEARAQEPSGSSTGTFTYEETALRPRTEKPGSGGSQEVSSGSATPAQDETIILPDRQPPGPPGSKTTEAGSKTKNNEEPASLWALGITTAALATSSVLAHFTDVFKDSKQTASLLSDTLLLFFSTLLVAFGLTKGSINSKSPVVAEQEIYNGS